MTVSEILWNFSRHPEESGMRVTLRQNPHFYLDLSKDAASYGGEFNKRSLTDFDHSLDKGHMIYVLIDKSCRLYLEAAKPRIFGNVWKPHQTVILKGEYSSIRVIHSDPNPNALKMSMVLWNQKTSPITTSERAKTTGIVPLEPPIRLSFVTVSNWSARVMTVKLSRGRS